MEKFNNKYENYTRALERLKESLQIDITDELINETIIDGVIQRFEFTFELAWKTIKAYLEYTGTYVEILGTKGILKNAFEMGIIKDGDTWIEMLEDRNSSTHRYSYEMTRIEYNNIKNKYVKLFEDLKEKLEKLS